MIGAIFLHILRMSATAAAVTCAVLLLRWLLRRAPRGIVYALWAVVLFRLLCPVTLEVPWGLLRPGQIESYSLLGEQIGPAGAAMAAYRALGDAVNGGIGMQHIPTAGGELLSVRWWEVWVLLGQYVWLLGAAVMAGYSVLCYLRLRRQLVGAVRLRDNLWQADGIDTPFVLGFFRPKIYLPAGLTGTEYILLHEQHHIRRGEKLLELVARRTHENGDSCAHGALRHLTREVPREGVRVDGAHHRHVDAALAKRLGGNPAVATVVAQSGEHHDVAHPTELERLTRRREAGAMHELGHAHPFAGEGHLDALDVIYVQHGLHMSLLLL